MRASVTLSLVFAAAFSQAVLTVYTDRAAFATATASLGTSTTETFDADQEPFGGDNLYNGVNYRIDGNVDSAQIAGGVMTGDEFDGTSLDIVYGSDILAWGSDFVEANTGSGLEFIIDGTTLALGDHLTGLGTGFFGVVSDTGFSVVDVTGGAVAPNEIYDVDNVTSVQAVPEPASMVVLSMGALALLRKKKR